VQILDKNKNRKVAISGGESGIRTHGTRKGTPVFKDADSIRIVSFRFIPFNKT
jgi:hypothetical protein